MRSSLILVIPLLAALMSGCFHGPVSSQAFGTNLVVQIWASSNCVDPAGTVALSASVTNTGSGKHIVELHKRPVLDLCVAANGGYKKCWSDGRPLTPELTRLELKPGESKSIDMSWLVGPAGQYGAVAIFIYSENLKSVPMMANVAIGVGSGQCPGEGMR